MVSSAHFIQILFSLLCIMLPALASAKAQYGYLLDLRARYANHLLQTNEQTSHRLSFQFSQNWKDGDWSSSISMESRSESAFAANPNRYSSEVVQKNSSEFLPRDVYLQYFSGPVFVRLGYQQVVWGEAFGFAYADVVMTWPVKTGPEVVILSGPKERTGYGKKDVYGRGNHSAFKNS